MPYKNKEEQKSQAKRYYESHKKEIKEKATKWNKENPERRSVIGIKCHTKYKEKEKQYSNNYKMVNKDKIKIRRRKAHIKCSYGISLDAIDDMLKKQNNCCAICSEPFLKTHYVDHNHSTGEVRGLLCRDCNFMIGLAKENLEILNNAIQYLKNKNNLKN